MPEATRAWGAYRFLVIVLVAGAGVVGFAHLTGTEVAPPLAASVPGLASLEGDLPVYGWRFGLSLLLLGVFPLGVSLFTGERFATLGLRAPRAVAPWWVWIAAILGVVAVAWVGARDAELGAYYPYSKTLVDAVGARGWGVFALHAALYFFLYYLPWELLFRGILVFPVVRLAAGAPRETLVLLATLPAIPSALLHFGHPLTEGLGAVFFGAAAGWLALETGSILPGLAIHAGIGILLDLFVVLRTLGVAP